MKKFEEIFKGISERFFKERGFGFSQEEKSKSMPEFETVDGVTPQQIEALEFLKQYTELMKNDHQIYLGRPVFISPLNKDGEIAESADERSQMPILFTHVDNDAYCGKFGDKYYRYFDSDQSLQVFYFGKNEDNVLQTTSISVNQEGHTLERCCTGKENNVVDTYQQMAEMVDMRARLVEGTLFDSQEQ